MSRWLLLLLLTVIIAGGLYFLLFANGSHKAAPDMFAVAESEDIGKIFMGDMSGASVVLEKNNSGEWIVNDKYPVEEASIKILQQTLRNIRVRRKVPEKQYQNVVRAMAGNNTQVEVYDDERELIKSYLVGSEVGGATGRGNFMKFEGDDEVYEVGLPGFEGNLTSRYFLEEDAWRSRKVFAADLGDIQSFEVVYNTPDKTSYHIAVIRRDSFVLTNPKRPEMPPAPVINHKNIVTLLQSLDNIQFEALANNYKKMDSIRSSIPLMTMSLSLKGGQTETIEIHSKPVNKRSKALFDKEGNPLAIDRDRYFAFIHDGRDFVIIQDFVFGKLMQDYTVFTQPPEPEMVP